MTNSARKRLIEELLPLAEIGVESSKAVGNGDIHAIHTWFARRPLAACRAATFASLVDAPPTEDERSALLELVVKCLPGNAPQKQPEIIEAMRSRIKSTYDGRRPRVLDPFAGGGSLPLEAARLGCDAYAQDINPNAILTLLGTVDYPIRFSSTQFPLPPVDMEDFAADMAAESRTGTLVKAVDEWGKWVLARVQPVLSRFYPADDGNTVVSYLWAKTIRCTNPTCQGEIPLVAHRWLSRRAKKEAVAFRITPEIDRTIGILVLRGKDAEADSPERGTMASGSVQCPHCPQTIPPTTVKELFQSGQDRRRMLAVAYRSGTQQIAYRSATSADEAAFTAASQALYQAIEAHDDPFLSLVPDEPFPEKGRSIDPGRYGVATWSEMYNDRQLLALTTFVQAIQAAHKEILQMGASKDMADAIALYLAFTLSRMSLRLTESSVWHNKRETIERATNGHKLPFLWDYAEANPIGNSSGSWQGTNAWALPSIERLLGCADRPVTVGWGDTTQMSFDDNFFDAVLTDPPYYDSVTYSDLSDMQYVWLHRVLKDIFPEYFPSPLTPKRAEIIQENTRHENRAAAKRFFEEKMLLALREINRVLKPDGIALIMYAHTDTSAWETLVSALINSGFQVSASWPVNTETMSRLVWLGGAVLQSTILLVCRKRTGPRIAYLEEILADMHKAVQQALARFWAAGIGGADFFISAIGPALSVFSRYDEVRYTSGQRVSVANFLTLVRQAVVDFSLQQALQEVNLGEVDRETQFALLWRWTYGHQEVETGAALLLDKATGVELAELEKRGLLGRVDNNRRMVLFGPEERPGLIEQTTSRLRGGNVPMIDLIHCADLLWRDNRREELNDLLAEQGDAMRKVAQALAEIQRNGHSERRLTLGFLGSWPAGLAPKVQPPPGRSNQIKEQQLAFDLDDPERNEDG